MTGNRVGTGYVPIKPDAEGFGGELERALEREGSPAAGRAGGAMAKAMKATFFAGVATIGKGVFDFAGFEKGMQEVFTLLPGISGEAMDTMSGQVKDFATTFGVLPNEVIPALYQSLSAGVPQDNVFTFLEQAQKLAKGGVTDLETAVDGLSSVVNAYTPAVIDAGRASDIMFTTVKLGKTTVGELSRYLFQIIPTAAGVGVKFEDVAASLAAMTAQGVPTAQATTQLRQLLVELSKSGSGTATMFEKLAGKSFRQFIAEGGNLQDALTIMRTGADDAGVAIADLFGSVEAASAANVLTGTGAEAFAADLAAMQGAAGATQEAFDTMDKGLAATWGRVKARLSVALLNIGEAIAPTAEAIGRGLGLLLELFGKLPGPMQAVAVLLGTITAGLFAFAKPISNGIALFKQLGGVWKALAANPWVLVLAGLVAVTVLIVKNWQTVKATLGIVWGWMRETGKAIGSFFVDLWHTVATAAEDAWHAVTGAVETAVGTVTDLVTGLGNTIGDVFGGIGDAIGGTWNAVTSATSTAWSTVTSIVTGAGSAVLGFLTGIPKAITGAFATLADVISAPFRTAFQLIKTVWNSTVGGFGFKTPSWIPFVGGKEFRIPSMAGGGVLTGPQLLLAGEYPGARQNPEIVAPQNIIRQTVTEAIDQRRTANIGGAPISVAVTMNVASEVRDPAFFERQAVEIGRVVGRELERSLRAQGVAVKMGTL